MSRLRTTAKIVLLGALAFALAAGIGATDLPNSYLFALLFSVALCPGLLGYAGARLSLGPIATLFGINFLPVLMALAQRFHLGQPANFGWLLASFVFAWAGWRLGRRAAPAEAPAE